MFTKDRAQAQFQPLNADQNLVDVDEISEYCDARYVSAIEAVWHIFHFTMHFQTPPVLRLDLHLENKDTILFSDAEKVADIKNKQKLSKFTAWFKLNQEDIDARLHLYHDIPKYYVWKSTERVWQKRKRVSETKMIGRMHFISPNDMERFCLRLLVLNVMGATSYEYLRTFDNKMYSTYQEAAIARGLMRDDKEWDDCLTEASVECTDIHKLRTLFVMILSFCEPSSPFRLWENHKQNLSADLLYKEKIRSNNPNLEINNEIYNQTLYEIDLLLRKNGKYLSSIIGMPKLPENFSAHHQNSNSNIYINQQFAYDREALKSIVPVNVAKFNPGQLKIYNEVIKKINNKQAINKMFFVDGPGGDHNR